MYTHHIRRAITDRLLRVGERPACPKRVRETRQNTSGIVFKRGSSPQRVRYACDLTGSIAREADCLTGRVEHRHNIVVFIVLKSRKHTGRIGNLQDIAFRRIFPRCGFSGTIENSYRVRIHYQGAFLVVVRVYRHGIAEVFHISSITHTYREQPILLIPGVRVIGTLRGTLTLNMTTRIGGAHQARSVTLGNADPVAESVIAHRHARTVGRRDAYQATFRVGDPQVLILTGTSIGNNRG